MLQSFITTFLAVFLAEMGDKTQLATFGFAAQEGSKLTVFLAASLALITASAIGVLAGSLIGKTIPIHYIKYGSGILFIGIGVWTIWKAKL
ncbi:MAG: TMEM165/GDT1 family protein [bacterium]|nr:TMEM165/GDT1 family protein [bacterium]